MVYVVVATVDVGDTTDFPACSTPHLRHVDIWQSSRAYTDTADRIPDNAMARECFLDILRHLVDKRNSGARFIGTHVDVRSQGKGRSQLCEQLLHRNTSLLALHSVAHCCGESSRVTRHIDFRDDDQATLSSVCLQFGTLRLGVIPARKAGHRCRTVQLRIVHRLETETLVIRQMPVEDINLKTCQQVDLLL